MERRRVRLAFLAASLCLGAAVLSAQSANPPALPTPTVPLSASTVPTWDPWTFDFILRLFGADIGVGYRGVSIVPGYQTTFWVYTGGGWEGEHYYRDASGAFLAPDAIGSGGALSNANPAFDRVEGAWRVGIEQGLAWNPRISENLVETFLFYRGRYDLNQPAAGALLTQPTLGVLPDRDASLLNTLQLGADYNDLETTRHRTRDGLLVEATTEWGPSWFFNTVQGDSDFVRFNANLSWFVPLYDADPDRPRNLFSVYLGEYISADYAIGLNGTRVPLYVRQTFGGRTQNTALGAQVRGVDKGAYDANLKAVNNLEVRVNLPAIPSEDIAAILLPRRLASLLPDVIPGLIAYLDAGAYDQVGEPGIGSPQPGTVAAAGGGAFLEVPGLGELLLYAEYRLDGPNAAGDRVRLALEFGMQF